MMYQCTRPDCGEVFPSLLLGKIHIRQDHGIAWKQTRKWLRVMSDHDLLPAPIEPWEFEKTSKREFFSRSLYDQNRTLKKMRSVQDVDI